MTSNTPLIVPLLIAVGGGIAISIQSTLISNTGASVGPVQTAFYIHLGGAAAGALMMAVVGWQGGALVPAAARWNTLGIVFLVAGLMGMITLPSIALSFPRVGLVAGQLAIIGGQTVVALIVDTTGLVRDEPIPLDWQRILGLLLLVAAAYLLVPKAQ